MFMKPHLVLQSFIVLQSVFLGNCAFESKREREIDRKIAQEAPAASVHAAVDDASALIQGSKSLSPRQKEQMTELLAKSHNELDLLRKNGNQIKTTIFRSLATGQFKPIDIGILKEKLRENENKKIDVIFSSLFQVREVLGYNPTPAPLDFELHNLYRDM